jgi:pimeloyl-ACP methyl ester carboxylesterase
MVFPPARRVFPALKVFPLFAARTFIALGLILAPEFAAAQPEDLTYENYQRDLAFERNRVSAGGRIAQTPCGPIEFASVGEGPVLLLVHGAGGGYDQGLDFAQDFARQGFRVVTMSRFGYLGTPMPKDASPAAQADAHACLLDALKIDRAAVIGASAGAPSTMQLALRHPRRVSAMLLLVPLAYTPDANPRAPAELPPPVRFMLETAVQFEAAVKLDLLSMRSDLLFWLGLRLSPATMAKTLLATPSEVLDKATADERARIERTLRHMLPLSLRQQGLLNDLSIVGSLPRYELEKIEAPTLVVSAADDLYGTYAMARYTAAHIPGARFIGYPSGGHMWVGRNAELLGEVQGFFGGVQPPIVTAGSLP